MAVIKWKGDAKAVAQVDVQTIAGTPAAGSWFDITIGGKTLRYTIPATVVSGFTQDLIDGIILLWTQNAQQVDGIAEFAEVALTQYDTSKLAFTSLTPGVPFTFTYNAGGGATQSNDGTNSVANASPNDAANTANYTGGALPSAGDELWFDDCENGPEFGLTALAAIGLIKVVFTANFRGRVGRAPRVIVGRSNYIEYRAQYLQLKSSASSAQIIIDCPSSLIRLDTQTFQFTILCQNTGGGTLGGQQQAETAPTVCWKGTHASNAVVIDKGSFGAAYYPSEVATILTLRMGYVDDVDGDAVVWIGSGVTLGSVNKTGGNLTLNAALTTLVQFGGETTVKAGAITTATIYGGTFNQAGTGTITTYTGYPNTKTTMNESNQARTITTATFYPDSEMQDPGGSCLYTNAISVPGGSPTQIKGTFGAGRAAAISFI